jgi:hypothetical protein
MSTRIAETDQEALHLCPACGQVFAIRPVPPEGEWPPGCLDEGCESFSADAERLAHASKNLDIGPAVYRFQTVELFETEADQHVIPPPKYDLERTHIADVRCWCHPTRDAQDWRRVLHG